MWRQFGWIAVLAVIPLACGDEMVHSGQRPEIQTAIIPSSAVPRQFEEGRVYEYAYGEVDPESVLLALWSAGIPVSQAWLPLDNRCMDIRGPRFTVELSKVDQRIEEFNFVKGTGRLGCSTTLKRYTISR